MSTDTLRTAIYRARNVALNAVEYVGFANYADREREALKSVRDAFDKIEAALASPPAETSDDKLAAATRKWLEYERDFILPCFKWAAEVGYDLQAAVCDNPGKNCVQLLVEHLRSLATPTPAPQPAAPSEIAAENCRLYAARHRKEPWAKEILRMLADQGIKGSPLRAAPSQPAAEAPSAAPSAAAVGELSLKLQQFVNFLCGAEPFEGYWFWDKRPDEITNRPAAFWWRTPLRSLEKELVSALAPAHHPQPAPSEAQYVPVYVVSTGEMDDKGRELFTLHDQRVPMCDQEVLFRSTVYVQAELDAAAERAEEISSSLKVE